MSIARRKSEAGYVIYPNGDNGILVAGGESETSSEFYNLQTGLWTPKASLPVDFFYSSSVPYQDSFLIVGGRSYSFGDDLDTIFKYNADLDQWDQFQQTLRYARYDFAAFLVPDSFCQ